MHIDLTGEIHVSESGPLLPERHPRHTKVECSTGRSWFFSDEIKQDRREDIERIRVSGAWRGESCTQRKDPKIWELGRECWQCERDLGGVYK